MRKLSVYLLFFIAFGVSNAQIDMGYQNPPVEILELADVPLQPFVLIDDDSKNIVLLHRERYKSIVELSGTEMRLAGLRINPVTNPEREPRICSA